MQKLIIASGNAGKLREIQHLLQPLDLLAMRLVEGLARDLLSADDGGFVAAAEHLVVAGNAEEDESRKDPQQDDAEHDLLVFANYVEHVVQCPERACLQRKR